jgi:stage V sporulation protein G
MKFEVRIFPVSNTGNLKAYASVALDKMYNVTGLRVLDGEKGLWISMPAQKTKKGEYKDVFFPINSDARKNLIDAVLKAYEESVNGANTTK